MAVLPFGLWDVGESFNQAVDYEEEEEEQYEIEDTKTKTQFQFKNNQLERYNKTFMDLSLYVTFYRKKELHKTMTSKISNSAETLILCWGQAANAFVETYFNIPNTSIGEITIENTDKDTQLKIKREKRTCHFYRLKDNILCCCQLILKPEDNLDFIEMIASNISYKQMAVLSSSPKSLFQCNDDDVKQSDMDVLRSLTSSKCISTDTSVPQLEEGNIIDSLPAAGLSYCEQHSIPCVLYMNYTESHYVDVFSLKTYEVILSDKIMNDLPKVSSEVLLKRLKLFDGIGVADNNLYI